MLAIVTSSVRYRRRGERGFTLLELAIALTIITILAGIGYGAYRSQVLRARRTEAVLGLEGIYRAQTAYKGSTGRFGDTFDEIGFQLSGAKRVDERTIQGAVYTFTVQSIPLAGDPRGSFQALATGNLDTSDPTLDILMIENYLPSQP